MKETFSISFIQDNKIQTIDPTINGLSPTTTLLNYLRNSATHKGTKEGCAEGDCGACTVVIGELNHENKIKYTAVDSCLVFLPMLHGKQLITVENLSEQSLTEHKLHPVQQAMVETNGSQCGYCTPGFIMSLFGLYKNENNPSRESICDALTGNLCRCTGYLPIIEAAEKACIHHGVDHIQKNENSIQKLLLGIQKNDQSLIIKTKDQSYFQPASLNAALQLRSDHQNAILINGATDIALRVTKKNEFLEHVIDLSAIRELKYYEKNKQEITIGSGTSLEEIKNKCEQDLPALHQMLAVFGSRQIRSLATLGGNVGSASPIGDALPVLIAYEAEIQLQSINGNRSIPMNEFITGYRQTQLKKDELITGIKIPLPGKNKIVSSYKISKRKDLDISTVNGGFMIQLSGNKVEDVILAYGGMAATTKRASSAEKYLQGKTWDKQNVEEAAQLIYNEFTPISDARSGAEFRRLAARNLLVRFWSESK